MMAKRKQKPLDFEAVNERIINSLDSLGVKTGRLPVAVDPDSTLNLLARVADALDRLQDVTASEGVSDGTE